MASSAGAAMLRGPSGCSPSTDCRRRSHARIKIPTASPSWRRKRRLRRGSRARSSRRAKGASRT
uniref:Uncharacterized protein n=1 Tax=Arundo donax TaxID=35708 RepID=A0A0A9HI70_ARUDO